MNISIGEQIKQALGSVQIGRIVFEAKVEPGDKNLWNQINTLTIDIEKTMKMEEVNKIQTIADTRKAYKLCGKDPNRYRPSADSLHRRVIKGNGLYKVNNVVDCLNFISLKSGFSIGGYDLEKIEGDILLDKGTTADEYYGIGRGLLNIENLPVLRDKKGVFGSPTSDSERTMINGQTTKVVFCFFDFGDNPTLEDTLIKTSELLKTYANGNNFEKKILEL